jgi:hypothetical protein
MGFKLLVFCEYDHLNLFHLFMMCFQDLLNFDDPLNVAAAEHYERDKVWLSQYPVCAFLTAFLPQESFVAKVKEYVQRYAKR